MKYFIILLVLMSNLFAWPHKLDQVNYYNIKCDVWENKDWGYTMTYFVQVKKPYAILYMKIKCPNGNVWRLKNVEMLL